MGNRSPSKIRREGCKAFWEGKEIIDNPYKRGFYTLPYNAYSADIWEEGYKEAETAANETLGDLIDTIEEYKENDQ